MPDNFEAKKIQLIHDLRSVIHDAQELIQTKSNDYKIKPDEVKDSMTEKLNQAMDQLRRMELKANAKIENVTQQTENYVQHHPLKALGLSAGIGILIGLLIKRN